MSGFVMPGQVSNSPGGSGGSFSTGQGSTPTLEISVACQNLANKDWTSKSDPFCVLYELSGSHWQEMGRTETIQDCLEPAWQTKFLVNNSQQLLKFEVYDHDKDSSNLKRQDFLGGLEVPLANLVTAPGGRFISVMKEGPSKRGRFTFVTEARTDNSDTITLQLAAEKVDKKDMFSKSDPYFVLSKSAVQGNFVTVHKSETIKNTLNPVWAPITIPVVDVCNGDYDRKLQIEVYDWDSNGSHDIIGSFTTTLREMGSAMVAGKDFPLINSKKLSKKGYKNSGIVKLKSFKVGGEYQLACLPSIKRNGH
ncbi:hypothetical protein TCAL_12492 [Tigriopus californicus]|uniref:C2 domain-containing protein n=1 Tax=Tigriopus californicus TaxID=6832 RepID=A0A553P9U2_TIGCA|nr:copine-5-like [Tigriopus californicus]TRY74457.1 hypothetical protein TCAL_12492 [Tigriopus californicus]|eukprot:TCALIF_12492-PA protein Name:"Similar to CPNE5 Copine-5 (Homo sapiens)" AED:0.05 eAED:0.06 QI:0/-1/0/1/-1/1/1/0/307